MDAAEPPDAPKLKENHVCQEASRTRQTITQNRSKRSRSSAKKHSIMTDDEEERVNPLIEWLKHEIAEKENRLRVETERKIDEEVRR